MLWQQLLKMARSEVFEMSLKSFLVIFGCFGGFLVAQEESPTNQAYLFSADAETLLYQNLAATFSCQGREYGYYADVDNNCQVK